MFRNGMRVVVIGMMVFMVCLASAVICHADFTPPTLSTTEILAIAGAVFTALAAIWFVKKGVKLLNRS